MYLLRTNPDNKEHLKVIDDILTTQFIPALSDGHCVSINERLLLSLPARYGGLGIPILSEISDLEFTYSQDITSALSKRIIDQTTEANLDEINQMKIKN